MLRSILVPLDGSSSAEQALSVASRMAQAAGATLHLVMARDPTQGIGPFAELGPPSVLLLEEAERREADYLARSAARLRKAAHLRVKVHYEDGLAGKVIARVAKKANAGLVVMSTHGRGALGRLGLGSVADYVVRHLDVPILILPAGIAPLRRYPGRSVLVPLDLSEESGTVLRAVEELGRLHRKARVTLVHVVESVSAVTFPTMPYPMIQDSGLTELRWDLARKQLARASASGRRRGLTISTRLVAGARAAAAILAILHKGSFDLVAMTTHGYGGLRRLLLGSVANKVIRHARKPVLVIRPPVLPRARKRSARK